MSVFVRHLLDQTRIDRLAIEMNFSCNAAHKIRKPKIAASYRFAFEYC